MSNILETIKIGNPLLREVASLLSIEEILSEDIQDLIEDMRFSLDKKEYGVGLSAPQIGRSLSLSIIAIKPTPTLPDLELLNMVIINPQIIETFGEKKNMWEGCISSGEGNNTLCAKVPRPNKIQVQWLDEYAVEHNELFEGFIAHTLQHEVDHLNGILFVDRVEDSKTYMLVSEFEKFIAGK